MVSLRSTVGYGAGIASGWHGEVPHLRLSQSKTAYFFFATSSEETEATNL
jgi:hypothetical protein